MTSPAEIEQKFLLMGTDTQAILWAEIERLRMALKMIAGGYWGNVDVQEYARRVLNGNEN